MCTTQKPAAPQPAKEPKQSFNWLSDFNSVGLAGLQEAKLVHGQGLPCITAREESTNTVDLPQSLVSTSTLWPFRALHELPAGSGQPMV